MNYRFNSFASLSLLSLAVSAPGLAAAATCESLTGLPLKNATITTALSVPAGSYTPPGSTTALTGLPAFCRIAGVSTPTSDSIINFEVWIPVQGSYNGKYEQNGNGGFAGSIPYSSLAEGIRRGYAAAGTDDGSQARGLPTFALGHPQKIIDFGYRALKETTDKSKAIIQALTGSAPRHSYFMGCSDGGREALQEAQRYPEDFDGIVVGSPANAWTHLFAGFVWNEQALLDDPASYVPSSKLPLLSKAVLAACVGQDGGVPTDTFLNDPRDCHFDPSSIQCSAGQDPNTCLTPAQVTTVKKIYSGPHDPRTGALIFPGYEPGSESNPANWPLWITGATPGTALQQFFGNGFFADFVFQNAAWDFHTLNFDTDVAYADNGVGVVINSINPDLRPFKSHGGKMIHYVGWADSAIAPMNSVNYYNEVARVVGRWRSSEAEEDDRGDSGRDIRSFYRLFMVPGMAHCGGGDGPNAFGNGTNAPIVDPQHDLLKALERWVEDDVAPRKIIATHYVNNNNTSGVAFQRPLCPYPQIARYKKGEDPTQADSFVCVKDETDHDPRDQ
jgi:Tannase and feruloyl esterase